MEEFSKHLHSELEAQLQSIHSKSDDPLIYARQAIRCIIQTIDKLKSLILKYRFKDREEEIRFFREVKPQFTSRLIYYSQLHNIAVARPPGTPKVLNKYYKAELRKLQFFSNENSDFYSYFRSDSNYLDTHYFLRNNHNLAVAADGFYAQTDHRFATVHDYTVARILANERLAAYLEGQIGSLEKNNFAALPPKKIKWTGSKVALVELVYALHAGRVLNNGTVGLKETAALFEAMFDIDLGQFHRTFLEIRGRKSERTKFLTALAETLTARMEDADEQ